MRALLFITYLFTLLLAGGNKMDANTHKISSAPTLNLKNSLKGHNEFLHFKRGYSSLITIDTDFDLDEEYSSNESYKNSGASKIDKFKQTVLAKWYLSNDNSFITSYPYNRFYFTKPISGQTTPIYIIHSVLRV